MRIVCTHIGDLFLNASIEPPVAGQVRFKDEFHGHSEKAAIGANDTVAEWRALQDATPPVHLADHLTWLRHMGITKEPRLLRTVADRPDTSLYYPLRRQQFRRQSGDGPAGGITISPEGAEHQVGDGLGETAYSQHSAESTEAGSGVLAARRDGDASESEAAFPVLPIVPLEPFLKMMKSGHKDDSVNRPVAGHAGGNEDTAGARQGPARLTHDVKTLLEERLSRLDSTGEAGNEDDRGGPALTMEAEGVCDSLHLVVDGVVFQVEATRPALNTRVWENVLPAVSERSVYTHVHSWNRELLPLKSGMNQPPQID